MGYTPFTPPSAIGMQPAAFSDVGGHAASQQVWARQDLYTPFELTQVFERQGMKPTIGMWMKMLGFSEGVDTYKVGHYEGERDVTPIRFSAVDTAAGAPGANLIMAIDDDYQYDAGVTVNGAARNATPGRVGEQVLLANKSKAHIIAKDTSVTPHLVTLRPINENDNLDLLVAIETNYALIDNAWGEGTELPRGVQPRLIKYQNDFQIVKETVVATGTELTNRAYVQPIKGREGSMYIRSEWQTVHRFEEKKSNALLFGTPGSNIKVFNTELGYDVDVRQTEGMDYFARTNGYNVTYDEADYTTQDFRDIGKLLEAERIGVRDYCFWMGYDLYGTIEESLDGRLSADITEQLIRTRVLGGASPMDDDHQPFNAMDLAMNIGFTAVKIGGYSYTFKLLHEFNDGRQAGLDTYNYKKSGILHPLGYTTNYNEGGSTPIMGYKWKQQNGYSRENQVGVLQGIGVSSSPVMERDITKTGMLTEIAFHATTGNHFIYMTPE